MVHPKIKKLLSIPQFEQRSPEWFAQRKDKLTSSDAASVLGTNPYSTKTELLYHKCGLEKPYQLPLDKNVFKWLGPIEPNYIVSVEKYQIISNALSYDIKKRNFERWKSDLLKITPTY